MKVLFIANYKNLSGYSTQAVNHILSLDKAGVEVIPKHINLLNNNNPDISPRILELEQGDCKNSDVIILNTLPSLYERSYKVKTVGYYMCETSNFKRTNWSKKINLMDAALVPCYANKLSSIESYVRTPIHIVPLAIDLTKTYKKYPITEVRRQNPDKFIFYTIGEWTARKNVDAIIKAFHLEFGPKEPVELLIKTTPTGLGDNPQQAILDKINNIKQGLKLYNDIRLYKGESIICGYASEEDIGSIHQSSDCFISSSRGEAFNIPLAEALSFGKIVISGDHSGMDYINDKNAYVISSAEQPCFNANDTIEDLYCGNELWNEISISSLMRVMRDAFTKKDLNRRKVEQAKKDVQQFSFDRVGKIYRETLEKII